MGNYFNIPLNVTLVIKEHTGFGRTYTAHISHLKQSHLKHNYNILIAPSGILLVNKIISMILVLIEKTLAN